MPKNILVNASILDENPTGLGVYTKNVVKKLKDNNKNVKIFSPTEIEGVEIEKITEYVKPKYKLKGGLMRFLWTQFVLPFKSRKDDIIYHPFQYLCLMSRCKQIITIHDFIPLYYPSVAKHQNFYYKYIMPILLKKAYKIICISENTKRDILKFYKVDESKIKVVYNGFEEEKFNCNNVKKEVLEKYNIDYKYMVMVGAGYKHKNIEIALKALANLKDLEFKYIIVGKDSEYIQELKELAEKLNISDKVNFIGYISDEDLVSLYGNSYAFLYTTLYEGFGLPILEAMSCRTVVLSANNSSLPEVYGDAAIDFDAKDSKSLEEAIKKIIGNEKLREELIEKSKENIKKFSWDKTACEISKVLNS